MSKASRTIVAGAMSTALVLLPAAVVAAPLGLVADASAASVSAPMAKHFKNCTALNKMYPHGVGKSKNVKDHTSGTPVTNFKVSKALYLANEGSDRDKDGIACEKR